MQTLKDYLWWALVGIGGLLMIGFAMIGTIGLMLLGVILRALPLIIAVCVILFFCHWMGWLAFLTV